jgi:hypothetical protein
MRADDIRTGDASHGETESTRVLEAASAGATVRLQRT